MALTSRNGACLSDLLRAVGVFANTGSVQVLLSGPVWCHKSVTKEGPGKGWGRWRFCYLEARACLVDLTPSGPSGCGAKGQCTP
jgi:hypothetical protein